MIAVFMEDYFRENFLSKNFLCRLFCGYKNGNTEVLKEVVIITSCSELATKISIARSS